MYELDRPVGVGGWPVACQGKVVLAQLNARRDYLACVALSDEGHEVLVCRFCKDSWVPCSRVPSVDASCIAWSPNDILALGSDSGELQVVLRHGEDDTNDGGLWSSLGRVFSRPGRRVAAIEFAPRCSGTKLAFACSDGRVLVLEPELEFQLDRWRVASALPLRGGAEVTCLSWRASTSTEPEAIAVGGDFGVSVFAKCGTADWVVAFDHQGSQPVRALSWGPPLGKTFDKIAVGSGNEASIWKLGPCENGDQGEYFDFSVAKVLPCRKPVLSVAWNWGGFRLAIECGGDEVHVWEELVDGTWVCDTKLEGATRGLRELRNSR